MLAGRDVARQLLANRRHCNRLDYVSPQRPQHPSQSADGEECGCQQRDQAASGRAPPAPKGKPKEGRADCCPECEPEDKANVGEYPEEVSALNVPVFLVFKYRQKPKCREHHGQRCRDEEELANRESSIDLRVIRHDEIVHSNGDLYGPLR